MITEAKQNEVISIGDASSYNGTMHVVVVDVLVGPLLFHDLMAQGWRRPSRCIIHLCQMIILVEHVVIPDLINHIMSRSIISSGYTYSVKQWVSFMKQQCERLACATEITNYPYNEDLNKIGIIDLSKMVLDFYGGVTTSSSAYNWTMVLGNRVDEMRIMIKNTIDNISSEEQQFTLENFD
ncbi:hypothetical protein M9H77_19343 [Catharanthus roseus]|uniref:Uncharacterized protein n=1 Tax=Catharanthus roseus TaxID=4058 RepID=A0ACC0BA37_CATRO|nr:hypothetical protein M9H77_19343 [Catharanthus roseus]